jgi:hypothetical protein
MRLAASQEGLSSTEFHVFISPDLNIPCIRLRRLKKEPEAE